MNGIVSSEVFHNAKYSEIQCRPQYSKENYAEKAIRIDSGNMSDKLRRSHCKE
jgi:hypothetical protein